MHKFGLVTSTRIAVHSEAPLANQYSSARADVGSDWSIWARATLWLAGRGQSVFLDYCVVLKGVREGVWRERFLHLRRTAGLFSCTNSRSVVAFAKRNNFILTLLVRRQRNFSETLTLVSSKLELRKPFCNLFTVTQKLPRWDIVWSINISELLRL